MSRVACRNYTRGLEHDRVGNNKVWRQSLEPDVAKPRTIVCGNGQGTGAGTQSAVAAQSQRNAAVGVDGSAASIGVATRQHHGAVGEARAEVGRADDQAQRRGEGNDVSQVAVDREGAAVGGRNPQGVARVGIGEAIGIIGIVGDGNGAGQDGGRGRAYKHAVVESGQAQIGDVDRRNGRGRSIDADDAPCAGQVEFAQERADGGADNSAPDASPFRITNITGTDVVKSVGARSGKQSGGGNRTETIENNEPIAGPRAARISVGALQIKLQRE